jgi:acyl carrier protein
MQRLSKAIKTVFSDFDESQFSRDLEMGQIPGWDSMNSINLQMQIESMFNIQFGEFNLNDYHKVSDIINFMKGKGISFTE